MPGIKSPAARVTKHPGLQPATILRVGIGWCSLTHPGTRMHTAPMLLVAVQKYVANLERDTCSFLRLMSLKSVKVSSSGTSTCSSQRNSFNRIQRDDFNIDNIAKLSLLAPSCSTLVPHRPLRQMDLQAWPELCPSFRLDDLAASTLQVSCASHVRITPC